MFFNSAAFKLGKLPRYDSRTICPTVTLLDAHATVPWPNGKKFAFTIFDDTDHQDRVNVPPVYDFLQQHGLITTKSVWPLKGRETPLIGGLTCEDEDNRQWLLKLQNLGYEIALHNVTFHTSLRAETGRGLDRFQALFGADPKTMANHADCRESIYWGDQRLSGIRRRLYNLLTRNRNRGRFRGHIAGSPLYWGDFCKERITYVRNFVFQETNTLKACPVMPYHDAQRPDVNFWFASTEGSDVAAFTSAISEARQDRLETEGGACIMYTHFASGFYQDGRLNPQFAALIKRLAAKDGWFVPVGTLLDHIRQVQGDYTLSGRDRSRLEWKWLRHKMASGGTR
ncbi:MAG: hypothetical protein IIA59_01985 [Candidatus Marinimicrobia bacterium]|nr:hypothetical protein [Candidatus Neomarinimicrobiota bacterium]